MGFALPVAELPLELVPPVVSVVALLVAVLVVPPDAELAPPVLEWPPDGGGATSARAVARSAMAIEGRSTKPTDG